MHDRGRNRLFRRQGNAGKQTGRSSFPRSLFARRKSVDLSPRDGHHWFAPRFLVDLWPRFLVDLCPDFALICGPDFLRKLRSWCYCYVTAEWKNWHESEKKVTQIVRSVAREGKEGLVVKTSDAGKPLNWSCGKKLPNNIGLVAKRQTDFPGRQLLKLDLNSGFVFLKFSNELDSTPSTSISN